MKFSNPTYADYVQCGGKISKGAFEQLINDAVSAVSMLTFTRSENPPSSMCQRVKCCICELVDIKYSYKRSEAALPHGFDSISRDGLSVSRTNSTAGNAEQQAYEAVCRKYLLMPVNLLYAGVR